VNSRKHCVVQTSTPNHIGCNTRSVGTGNGQASLARNHLLGLAHGEETPVRGHSEDAARWSGPDAAKAVNSRGVVCRSSVQSAGAQGRWTNLWPTI